MELKSPLTVRQGSAIPFEQQQPPAIQYTVNDQPPTPQPILMSQSQTPQPGYTNGTLAHRQQFIDNPYNNRGILKSNGMINNQGIGYPVAIQQQQQQIQPPTRNVFLNRAYSETPRVAYTNGYETDSGLPSYSYKPSSNPYNTTRMYNTITANNRGDIIDQESTGVINTNNVNNSYRTLGPSTSARYNIINDQSGYDTDTGLMKLRHVLDNNRRASSRNNMPINQPNGYYYNNTNRSMTPLFNYQSSQQPTMKLINQDVRYNSLTPDPLGNSQYSVGSYPVVDSNGISFINGNNGVDFIQPQQQQQQPQINTIQYIDSNGNITAGIPALVTADGNQIIIQELDPNVVKYNPNLNQSMLTSPSPVPSSTTSQAQPTSLIIHQQVAPSAYNSNTLTKSASSTNNTLLKNNNISNTKTDAIQNSTSLNQLNNNNNLNAVTQNRDTPTRLGISTSATNLAQQKQKQLNSSISQQINNGKDDSRRASASSLSGKLFNNLIILNLFILNQCSIKNFMKKCIKTFFSYNQI
jgi:hypothetical protein